MNSVVINSKLCFNWDDLTKCVDFSKKFTLRDLFNCVGNSKIPLRQIKKIIKCNYLEEYLEEVNKKDVKKNDLYDMDYLELYKTGTKNKEGGLVDIEDDWQFHGIRTAKKGIKSEKYALEFSPTYEIADLEIRISDVVEVYDEQTHKMFKEKTSTQCVMLLEVLYAVLWELCWNGSIKHREARIEELRRRAGEIEKEIKKVDK